MDTQFLQYVAARGLNCITTIRPRTDGHSGVWATNYPANFADPEQTARMLRYFQHQGVDTYFGLASYGGLNDKGWVDRRQVNVAALRSFWLDIDAGADKVAKHGIEKVYLTQQEAINALYAELHKGILPVPTYCVSSGEGIHVYWCMDEDIPAAEWRPIAERLGRYCHEAGLKVDSSRTADSSSVLRPVGTIHFKSNRTVQVLQVNALFTKQDLVGRLGRLPVLHQPIAATNRSSTSATAILGAAPQLPPHLLVQSSMGDFGGYEPSSFGKIIELEQHLQTGCRQMLMCHDQQMTLEEPMWRAALSIATSCVVDGREWIHTLSQQHPDYSPEATEAKAAQIKGPYKCADIERLNPSGCKGCPHRGRITTPVVLGYNPASRPIIVIGQAAETEATREFVIPEYPYPYKRGLNGGVYIEVPKRDEAGKTVPEEVEDFCVVAEDLYLYERVNNGDGSQSFLCRYHSPHDGVIEFTIPSSVIHTASKDFKDTIVGAGVPVHGNERWQHLSNFLNLSRNKTVSNKKASQPVKQLGWQPDGKTFVIGDTKITALGIGDAPTADRAIARKYNKAYKPTAEGNAAADQLDLWNETLGLMYDHDTAIANQFVIATALGVPFSTKYALDNHAGGIISLSSSGSGHGKTFTCQTALRVWGNPNDTTFSSKNGTTANAFMTTLGYVNSMPVLRDEITEMDGAEMANLAYDSTRLSDKERAEGSFNDIRENKASWRTFIYCTGNNSMYDMVSSDRDVADGPLRRITEINLPHLSYLNDTNTSRRLAQRISGIHGVAGRKLMTWFLANEEKAEALWEQTMTHFVNNYGATNQERYWINHLVSGCVGAIIAQHLDLLPFDPVKIIEYAGNLLLQLRQRIGYRRIDTTEYFDQFLTDNTAHMLRVAKTDTDEMKVTALELPHKQVYIRVEEDNKYIYVNAQLLKLWCKQRTAVLEDFEMELRRRGGVPAVRKRMLANTIHASTIAPTKVWRIPIGDST